jgi:hypothetical protein
MYWLFAAILFVLTYLYIASEVWKHYQREQRKERAKK